MFPRRVTFVGYFVLMSCLKSGSGYTSGNETLLKAFLFNTSGYDPSVRPDKQTLVSLTLVPTSLNSIDIKAQTMSISGWWVMTWTDSRLTWTPSTYDDISETHVFEDTVWIPSIVVYNSVNDLSAIDEDTIPVRVQSSGQLEWSPPCILTVSCNTDITKFPFDTQTCGVSIKTFGYTVQELRLEADADEIDLNYYSANGEWVLLDSWTQAVELFNYSQVTFNFKFERKPDFYGLNLILPVLMMSLMGLFIFLLPADSGEKMGYSLTVMLTFVVLMTLLAGQMPTTAEHSSYFEVYVVLVLSLCSLSVVLSIFNLNLYFRSESEAIPPKAQDFTRFLMRLTCQKKHNQTNHHAFVTVTASHIHGNSTPTKNQGEMMAEESSHVKRNSTANDESEVTWKKMAMVMDAVCFRVYIILVILFTVIFLSIICAK